MTTTPGPPTTVAGAAARSPGRRRRDADGAQAIRRYITASRWQAQWTATESPTIPPGPRWGRASLENYGQQRQATVSRPRRSAAVSERSPRSPEHPDCLSHGGSQHPFGAHQPNNRCRRVADVMPRVWRTALSVACPWRFLFGNGHGRPDAHPSRCEPVCGVQSSHHHHHHPEPRRPATGAGVSSLQVGSPASPSSCWPGC
jgi:hypothetical protein